MRTLEPVASGNRRELDVLEELFLEALSKPRNHDMGVLPWEATV